MKSKTIAYVAVCAAISIVCTTVAAFTSVKTAPIALCALCFVLAFKKTGWAGGASAMVVTAVITAILGKIVVLLMVGILACPYALLSHLLRKLKSKSGKIARAIIFFAFFTLACVALVYLSAYTAQIGFVSLAIEHGAWLVSLVFGVFCIPVDYLIDGLADTIIRRIK